MHHLCHRHIVDTPFVRRPVGCAHRLIFLSIIYIRYARDVPVHILRCQIVLFASSCATVYRCVDAPQRCVLMHSLQSHEVLIFSPVAEIFQPQSAVHGFQYPVGFLTIRRWILAYHLCHAGSQEVGTVVIGRRMGYATAVVLQRIACPDTAIGIVESVVVGIPGVLLPGEMTLDDRPHLAHIGCIGIKLEMPEQLVDIHQVHVVMVELLVVLRIAADVAIAVHRRAPFVGATREIVLLVHHMRTGHRDVGHLTLGIGVEMNALAVEHTQEIAHIGCTPAWQRHSPAHSAMRPHLPVPGSVCSHDHGSAYRIQISIGSIEDDGRSQVGTPLLCSLITLAHL